MKIGIAIPVCERPEYLQITLDSLKKSHFSKDTTLYFIDDATTNPKAIELLCDFTMDVNIIKTRNDKRKNMFYSLMKAFDYFDKNEFEVFSNLDSDVLVKPYWMDVLLETYSLFPNAMITGFNSKIHPTLLKLDGCDIKENIGGIHLLFNRSILKYVSTCLTNTNWDWKMSEVLTNKNIKLIATNPSVVQHIGKNSTLNHKKWDEAEYWLEGN